MTSSVIRTTVELATPAGPCPTSVFHPAGSGPWPAVLLYMDGVGMRPEVRDVAERIAADGYLVLAPDLFFRAGPYTAPDPAKLFTVPEIRAEWMAKFIGPALANGMDDTRVFLDYLASRSDVRGEKIACTGYCMGGALAFRAAATYPERIALAASFHPGGLANDQPTSPHLLASQIKGRIYVAVATDDPSFPDAQKQKLGEALTAAGVRHEILTYPAKHGWVFPDTPVYDAAQAARHHDALRSLLAETFG
jgi:carboxymethylenebutenolidase